MHSKLIAGATVMCLTLAACSKDTTAPVILPSAELLNNDVAAAEGDAASQDVELMQGPGGHFAMGLVFNALRWDCNREYPAGLTVNRTCVFKDANGVVQTAYDPQLTASVDISVALDGTINRGNLTATIHRTHEFTVTGLLGSETSRTWNGSGSGTMTGIRTKSDGSTRTYSETSTGTVENVVIPVPKTPTSWPLSGTIHRHVVITKADGTTVEREVTITFNGTEFVTVNVNGEDYQYDLANRGRPHKQG